MKLIANSVTRNDQYLISKYGKLQEAALFARAEISAIPETTGAEEEREMIEFALAPVERLARSLRLASSSTKIGATMKKRASAWLTGGGWDCLLEPARMAA
ncbi:hypothetical protein RX327_24290 [Bradyrhizobium sp. BEA-2-5]|uniref:hypothetical protein n=1 Tax=Bradyrhizobium sp. BEA-2-5 TaxID=3080015 RepID=UPI00293EB3D5|nr:hypothetical protein [Bradyrhizobium sp. BEA-2-5]WOH79024.1 hypothetical protein RX327_24290 [Bradyrhizobium sp. BEA-2-5]